MWYTYNYMYKLKILYNNYSFYTLYYILYTQSMSVKAMSISVPDIQSKGFHGMQ